MGYELELMLVNWQNKLFHEITMNFTKLGKRSTGK